MLLLAHRLEAQATWDVGLRFADVLFLNILVISVRPNITPDINPDRRRLHHSRCFRSRSGDLHRLRCLHEVACLQDCVYLFRSFATDP